MSGTSLLHPRGVPLQGNNMALPPGGQQGPTQGRAPGAPPRISLSGPSMGQMQDMADQGGPASPNGAGGLNGGLPDSFVASRGTLTDQHNRNKAAYQQSTVLLKRMDAVRQSLDKLAEKQDMVTMEDIVHEAGNLVSHGIDPIALAGILADAPQTGGGEALAGWIAHQDGAARQREQQLQIQHRVNRGQVLSSAMHLMMAHDNARAMMGQGIMPPGPGPVPGPSPGNGGPNALSPNGNGNGEG